MEGGGRGVGLVEHVVVSILHRSSTPIAYWPLVDFKFSMVLRFQCLVY